MKLFKTKGIVRLHGGLVGLRDDQAKDRSPALEKIGECLYRVVGPVVFKAGEEIGLETPDKATLRVLQDLDSKVEQDVKLKRESGDVEKNEFNMEELIMAMFDLEEGNDEHFTGRGKPRVKAVEAIIGYDITAEQCNEAWTEFKNT